MMHTATLERFPIWQTAGVVRVFAPGRGHGDPYTWAATVVERDPETVALLGVTRAPTAGEMAALARVALDAGYRFVEWERRKPGRTRTVRFKIAGLAVKNQKSEVGTRNEGHFTSAFCLLSSAFLRVLRVIRG